MRMRRMATAGAVLSAEARSTHQYTVHINVYIHMPVRPGNSGALRPLPLVALNQVWDDIVDSISRYMGPHIAYCGLIMICASGGVLCPARVVIKPQAL